MGENTVVTINPTLPANISTFEKIVVSHLMVLFGLGMLLAIINQPYFDQVYTVEDGVLEWLTVMMFGQTATVCWMRAWRLRGVKPAHFILVLCVTGFVFIFGLGEELSWGQRLFDWESSSFFVENNAQGESNLHNLIIGDEKVNKWVFGKGIAIFFITYLAVLVPLYSKTNKVKAVVDRLAIPIPKPYQAWALLGILIGVELIIKTFSETLRRGEMTEFAASVVVMLIVLFPKNAEMFNLNSVCKPQTQS